LVKPFFARARAQARPPMPVICQLHCRGTTRPPGTCSPAPTIPTWRSVTLVLDAMMNNGVDCRASNGISDEYSSLRLGGMFGIRRSREVGEGIFKMLCSQLTACDLAPKVIWVGHDRDKLFVWGLGCIVGCASVWRKITPVQRLRCTAITGNTMPLTAVGEYRYYRAHHKNSASHSNPFIPISSPNIIILSPSYILRRPPSMLRSKRSWHRLSLYISKRPSHIPPYSRQRSLH